jgi:hypothetical protein
MSARPAKCALLAALIAAGAAAQSNWSPVESGLRLDFTSVTWAGNQLVALARPLSLTTDSLATSPDGLTWTGRTANMQLHAVAWMDTQYVAVGTASSRRETNAYRPSAMISKDGVAWNPSAYDAGCSVCTRFMDVVWTGSRLVAVGEVAEIATSRDAVTWNTAIPSSGGRVVGSVNHVVWTGSRLVAFGSQAKGGGFPGQDHYITTSLDGAVWERLGEFTTLVPNAVIWTGSQVVAVGGEYVWRSPDGLVWSTRRIAPGRNLVSVAWTGNRYVAFASGTPSAIFHSQDGAAWAEKPFAGGMAGLAWTGKRLVAVGGGGKVFVSEEDPVPLIRPLPSRAGIRIEGELITVSGRKVSRPPAFGYFPGAKAGSGNARE